MTCIEIQNIDFSYPKSDFSLNISSFLVAQSEHVFIEGPSGYGKSTFLNLISGLIHPNSGSLKILNHALEAMSPQEKDRFRANHLGIIFQNFNLMPYLTVLENLLLPSYFSKNKKEYSISNYGTVINDAKRLTTSLQLPDTILNQPAHTLSIGQKQRVAIARALIGNPELIIADEPSSSLDTDNKDQFINLLINECNHSGATLLFVSHDPHLKPYFDTHYDIRELNQQ